MKKKLLLSFLAKYAWIKKNLEKLILVGIVHGICYILLSLPYINLLRIVMSSLPFVADWIVILVLFRPKKENFLKFAFILLGISFIFSVLHFNLPLEYLGDAVYVLIATFILLSLGELKNK